MRVVRVRCGCCTTFTTALARASSRLTDVGILNIAVTADVASAEDVTSTVENVATSLGAPTILINAAGILRPTRFLDIPESEWDAVVDVSMKGSFLSSKA